MVIESNGSRDRTIRFGPFELMPRSGELRRDGVAVRLPPQPFKVLTLLVENAGQLITREEIQQEIWGGGTFVDFDKGLNFCIKQIREALGDNAQSPRYVETLPRRGYRFIAALDEADRASEVNTISPESAGASEPGLPEAGSLVEPARPEAREPERPLRIFEGRRPALAFLTALLALLLPLLSYVVWQQFVPQAGPASGKIMLMVLPFENLNTDSADDYFSDGLTEEMIAQLGRLRPERLGVIARTTALTYKDTKKDIRQIGREMGVNYVLEGSVRRQAGRVRITAQLIQVSDQTQMWSEAYERSERDILQLQSDVANRVAGSLALELLTEEGSGVASSKTSHPEAYDAYLKGRYLIYKDTIEDFERSIPYFEEAIEKDPNFAPAHAGAAEARVLLSTWRNTPAQWVLPKAKAAALRAVELDPMLAEAHAALGSVNFWLEWDWPEAEANIKRALALNPSDPQAHLLYASYLLTKGEGDVGVSEVKQALKLDPVSLLTNGLAAYTYLRARLYDDAIAQSKRMLELEPKSPAATECLINAYIYKGMYQEALETIRRRMTLAGESIEEVAALANGDPRDAIDAGRRKNLERMKEAATKGQRVPASSFASVYADLGEKEMAFEWLEKAFAAREPLFVFFNIHPRYDGLRSDPRFYDLVSRMGLNP